MIAAPMSPRLLRFGMNLWPPYLGAGIRVLYIADDWSEARVALRLRLFNRNYIGTHFGGSLFAMTDPFFTLLLMHRLGRSYVVNHAGGAIDFLAPARGRVTATFRLSEAEVEEVRQRTAGGEKHLPRYSVDIVDEDGTVVARATHTLHVRLRNQ